MNHITMVICGMQAGGVTNAVTVKATSVSGSDNGMAATSTSEIQKLLLTTPAPAESTGLSDKSVALLAGLVGGGGALLILAIAGLALLRNRKVSIRHCSEYSHCNDGMHPIRV
jgi:hypothetical protein